MSITTEKQEQFFLELDGLHAQHALYYQALIMLDMQERYDLTAREWRNLFNQWLEARQRSLTT